MRPFLLVPLVVAAVATTTPAADAGTYPVSWHGADLHQRFGGLSQFAAGNYVVGQRATGLSIETAPGTSIGPGGFAVDTIAAPSGSRFVTVTVSTALCSGAPGMYGAVLAPQQPIVHHDHGSSAYCSWRTGSGAVDTPTLTLILGASNSGAVSSAPSSVELQALDARLADDTAPSHAGVTSPSAGGVVGTPSVELRWSAADALSGVAAVYVIDDAGANLGEIGSLPAPDLRLAVGQRTGGAASAAGSGRVLLRHAGESVLHVRVVDGAGNAVDSAPVRVTYVEPPRAVEPPGVRGTAMPGSALTCDGGTWAAPAPTLGYGWLRDGVPVTGADAASYTVAAADVGRALACRVTAANSGTAAGGAPTVVTSASVAAVAWPSPVSTSPPLVHGTATPGSTLTCDPGAWREPQPSLAVAWRLDGAVVAQGRSYVPSVADLGRALDCRVIATGPGTPPGEAVAISGAVRITATPGPEPLAAPTLHGAARQGGTVTCDPGRWRDPQPALSIVWRLDGAVVGEGATYTPGSAAVGRELDCRVTATGRGTPPGSTVLTTPATRVAPAAGAGIVATAYAGTTALDPARPAIVAAGGAIQLEGRLQAGEDAVRVVAEIGFPGTATQRWTVPLEDGGRFSAILRPARGGELVVRYAGDASTAPAEQRVAQLRVRPTITATFRARPAGRGAVRALTVQGRVTPAPGVPVRLGWQGQPRGRGGWQAFCRGAGIAVAADGRFTGSCGLAGRFFAGNRYRVTLPAAPLGPHAAATSAARRALVRR